MDIQSLSTAMSQNNVQQQASVLMLKKSIGMTKTQGADVINLLSSGVNQTSGLAASTQKPEEIGNIVDIYA